MTDMRPRPRSGVLSPRPEPSHSLRDRHGPSLRGFALLVALGDQNAALRAWERALDDGERADAEHPLPHPAGWLRRRVIRHLGELPHPLGRWLAAIDEGAKIDRRATLRALGTSDAVIGGLSALSATDRALVVAHGVEHLAPAELGEMLRLGEAATLRRVTKALRGYVKGASRLMAEEPWARRDPSGQFARAVHAAAGRSGSKDAR